MRELRHFVATTDLRWIGEVTGRDLRRVFGQRSQAPSCGSREDQRRERGDCEHDRRNADYLPGQHRQRFIAHAAWNEAESSEAADFAPGTEQLCSVGCGELPCTTRR